MRFLAFLAIIAMCAMLMYSTTGLPTLFDPEAPASVHVSPRYIEMSYAETGSVNFVSAVLYNYRAYDTLGEAAVIFTAGLAAALVVRSRN
jgi:multicomponent Na+:H+ antiporter subunit B